MTEDAELERELDELYAGPPGDFVATRNALAKRLRAERRRDDAARVAQLRRPSNAAFALNRAALASPDRVDALVAAGAALRDAQAESLRGGAADRLRDAVAARRAVTHELADDAVRALDAEGGSGENARDEMVATLEAASLDESVASLLRAGRLERTVAAPSGFDLLPDVPVSPARQRDRRATTSARAPRATIADEPPDRRVSAEESRREAREARAAERARARQAEADEAHAQVQSAKSEVERLERELHRAQRRLQDAEARARRADELARRADA